MHAWNERQQERVDAARHEVFLVTYLDEYGSMADELRTDIAAGLAKPWTPMDFARIHGTCHQRGSAAVGNVHGFHCFEPTVDEELGAIERLGRFLGLAEGEGIRLVHTHVVKSNCYPTLETSAAALWRNEAGFTGFTGTDRR